ncbi:glycoside hydrolase N-terminal domain-containing protein [Coraliomargarita algicola]|uniref:Glycoside hydrolase N-terminal domain-containing protein n=1 Tax=Coraliomargarita algicola TaxID=3092156 RepID=A0ABZ0RR94_9BACT|nr:glycoside hydrolase N-terminal domain-containing protein [Coraliomargarita sp. J2-16]WPJ97417.1 glycoside hydrolase N-terminal domain-containing protein [Coraliomargarita sp. J2-16]
MEQVSVNKGHTWPFPLVRPHAGVPLGNGRMGVLVWGSGQCLKLTISRADFWDHRGGKSWKPEMNYQNLHSLLVAGDESAIREIFSEAPANPGDPARSSVLPIGRVEFIFPAEWSLMQVDLDFCSAVATVQLQNTAGQLARVTLELCLDAPLLEIKSVDGLKLPEASARPAWESVGDYLREISFPPPEALPHGADGWMQRTPIDETVSVGWVDAFDGAGLKLAATLSEDLVEVLSSASCEANAQWWDAYWARVPTIEVPDKSYEFLLNYGLYKFAGLTKPSGVAATLQGPWIEDYQMPPWSSDYHFNINVQMCYWPAYRAGLFEHLLPLFRMIEGWLPILRENARLFVGIDDGYLLPHAVDDHCGIIGAFWTGTVDHACTAWVARMMFDYWVYSGDEAFLRETAFPFMKGAMRVYEAMLERRGDGSFSMALSVSPEYRGAAMNAWGRDASFQLAACHSLAESLQTAADVLQETPAPIWQEIREQLPLATVATEPAKGGDVVALWEGLALEESHRHHSHLAGMCPFDVFDFEDLKWRPILERSIRQWHRLGMGHWSGWCIPWAAMLHHRAGNPEVAVAQMHYWSSIYTNEGQGTLHDPQFSNSNLSTAEAVKSDVLDEKMQMDAGMCATTAVLDAMVHSRRGVLHLFQGVPAAWRTCAFENIHVEGGFRLSARRGPSGVEWVRITASRAGICRVANLWPEDPRGPIIEQTLAAGEVVELLAGHASS